MEEILHRLTETFAKGPRAPLLILKVVLSHLCVRWCKISVNWTHIKKHILTILRRVREVYSCEAFLNWCKISSINSNTLRPFPPNIMPHTHSSISLPTSCHAHLRDGKSIFGPIYTFWSRRAPFPIKSSVGNWPHVKLTAKKYVVEALLNLFPQQ